MTDTTKYKLNHSMIRVKDPEASVTFYEYLGMSVLQKFQFPDYKLDLYFLAYDSPKSASCGKHMSDREGVLELSYTYGIEKTHNGNKDPKGFGHICVSVDNIQAACKRLSDAGYKFQATLQGGYAFVLDPDEYWVKLIAQNPVHETENVTATDVQCYKMHHTMLRVKDKDVSLKFYEDIFGMTPKHTFRNPEAGFDSYFLGYGLPGRNSNIDRPNPEANSEGLLELTWNYGTEKKDGVVYHNGNSEPEGFGHICISVDDLEAACERFDKKGVSWQKRIMDGPFRVAFIFEPDGYFVEIIQNERFKPAGHEY
ncbi:Glyoxalase/Bleomycin resistance protein/Dihydroxybiphenyl dioxygenase [Bisporella sp. PMI_857]|nr:Glyoxalase/Bleomycin resistance protein/Dihydroxybiphenyl dioxygenase [Bisporella sp. PMI_857]